MKPHNSLTAKITTDIIFIDCKTCEDAVYCQKHNIKT